MVQEAQPSTGIPYPECGSKKSNNDLPDEQVSVVVDLQFILKNADLIDSIEGDRHFARTYDDIKNSQL